MKYSGKVLIAKETASAWTTKNPHAVDNVNQSQGPRTGNHGTPSKRGDFMDAKEARQPLATVINAAYGARTPGDYVDSKLEPIRSNVNEGRRKK